MSLVESTYPTIDAPPAARGKSAADRRFFFLMAIVCALTVFIGFAPSYYLKPVFQAPPPLSAMSSLHGIVFSAWVIVFVVQAGLIRYERPALHRQLGLLGAVLFGAVVAVGAFTAINAARLGHAPPGSPEPLIFLAVPITGIAGAAVLMCAALWNRARRDFHMRYALAALIIMTPPASHRVFIGAGYPAQSFWLSVAVANILLVAAIVYDLRSRKSVHPAHLWCVAVFALVEGGTLWAFTSPQSWLPIANGLTQT